MNYAISLKEAVTLEDAEVLRKIRNSCRLLMTRDTKEKSYEQQKLWFKELDRTKLIPFLVETKEAVPSVIGYGIIQFLNERYWLTGALLADYRGKGLGEQLFRLLIGQTGLPVWLEVLEDNLPAIKLYHKLGFRSVGATMNNDTEKCVITMGLHPEFSPAD